MKNSKLLSGLSGVLALMSCASPTWADTAGYVQFVNGQVSLTTAKGVTHTAKKGEAVSEGDTISTAQNASAQVKMQDGGFIAVRPDTQLKFDSFKFTGKAGQPESSFFSLFKGGFRAVTGLIGRVNKKDYRINTPAATIGIRGTDHETVYLPANIAGAMAGAYSKVNIGETTLTTNRGTINVLPNQMGFAAGLNQLPQLQPINTIIFTVAVAPREVKVSKESKQESKEQGTGQAQQAAPKEEATTAAEQGHPPSAEAPSEPVSVSAGPEPIRDTAVVDNTKLAASIVTTTTTAPPTAAASASETAPITPPVVQTTVLPVTASSGALILNASDQTVATGGTVVSVQNGIYSTQAKAAADGAAAAAQAATTAAAAATSAENALLLITTVNATSAATAISAANSGIVSVTPTVTAATALTPVNAATPAAAAQTAATNAAAQAASAQAALTANGSFADATAAPANTTTQSANTALQSANATLQASATTAATQNAALGTAQTAASNALTNANTSLTTANSNLNSVSAQNTAITTAQSGAAALLSTVQAAATAANVAAQAAQAAATKAASLQAAGDLTGAAAELKIAQDQSAIAQSELASAQAAQAALSTKLSNAQSAYAAATTAVTNATNLANTANTAANTAQTQATNASTAKTNADTALTALNGQVPVVNSNAATVAANAPIAAYHNPAVAISNFVGHLSMAVPVPASYNIAHEISNAPQANTQFVLDGSGNLVQMRSTSFQVQPVRSLPTTSIANADVKWSGGIAADTFKLADNSIYAGRWSGATVTVTDLANPATPLLLTPSNSLWAVLLTPASGYVQSLVGTTTYTKAGNTIPFDAAGNLGTLNSATLSANFTSQLVNSALNLTMPAASSMAGTYAVVANNMPIDTLGGFGGGTYIPTVACSGTCAAGAGGYSANIGGSFAGVAAASAGLSYDIWPTVSPNSPASNLVQGMVAFSTATSPTVAPAAAYNPNLIAVEAAGGQFGFGFSFISSGMLASPADLLYVTGTAGGASSSGALSSMTFRDIAGGSALVSTSTVTGGTATSANAPAYATTGIQYGAWTGYTGEQNTISYRLASVHSVAQDYWMYGPQGYVDTAYQPVAPSTSLSGAMAGTFTYHSDGATAPASKSTGLTGTLTSATVTANFVTMQASTNLAITMPGNELWGATVTNAPISSTGTFIANTPTVTHGVNTAVTCATCSGTVTGDFTGQNYAGMLLTYNLFNNATTAGSDVAGVVAMTRNWAGNTNPVVANGTPASTNVFTVDTGMWDGPINSATLAGNVLTGFSFSGGVSPNTYSATVAVSCPTCTATAAGQVATSGIYYGNWTAGSITQTFNATFPASSQALYWITGPEAGPLYLPQALSGTASYAFNGGQVSNGAGVAGTVQGTTALTLDFNRQTVGINLDVSIANTAVTPTVHAWNVKTVTGQEAALVSGQGVGGAAFYASTFNNGGGAGLLTVTVDGLAANVISPSSNINGQLTGTGLTGAIMSYNLSGMLSGASPSFENISGVAAFTGTAVSTATPHRYVSFSTYDALAAAPQAVLGFYANNPARVTQDVAGNLTQFDTQFVNRNQSGSSMTFASNTSTLTDHGTDAVSGISWGRWSGGTVNSTDRQTGVVTPVTLAGSMHWIAEPVATAATTLPTTGTYTYTHAGGTAPTDNLGNLGTLNSATLTANFSAQTVNLGVNATVAGATLNAAGTNVPIIQKTAFYASSLEPAGTTSHLTVTCTGGTACGTTLGGTVVGKFSGAGAIGAAMSYGLQNGNSTISGVAAFHR